MDLEYLRDPSFYLPSKYLSLPWLALVRHHYALLYFQPSDVLQRRHFRKLKKLQTRFANKMPSYHDISIPISNKAAKNLVRALKFRFFFIREQIYKGLTDFKTMLRTRATDQFSARFYISKIDYIDQFVFNLVNLHEVIIQLILVEVPRSYYPISIVSVSSRRRNPE